MPWTFAHPAFILPLRRLGLVPLGLAALAVGSMMPDLGFYLGLRGFGSFAHTLAGSVLVGLPSGLVVLALVTLLRRPLIFLLPDPHRTALMARWGGPLDLRPAALISIVASVQIGVWSHLFIDLFTHAPPPGFGWLGWLSWPLGNIAGRPLLVHTAMQTGVSAVAVVILVVVYRRWLARVSRAGVSGSRASFPRDPVPWRWWLQGALLLGAGLGALIFVILTAPPITTMRDAEYQVFRLLVMATMVYVPALIAAAVMIYLARGRAPAPASPA